jgi:hypothetical protein
MSKHWKEPLDPARHVDHFHAGGAIPRRPVRGARAYSYFVVVAGFTFELASLDQIKECLAFFSEPIHGTSRKPVFAPESGHWESWHERLPARILKGSKRERVMKALRDALEEFSAEETSAR